MAAAGLWGGGIVSLGLILMIFGGFKSGFATATEISAFAVLYALVVGGVVFRELGWRAAAQSFVQAATRSGLVLFIVLGGAVARLRSHPAAGAACRGRDAGQPLGLARHLALPAAVDRHPDRDGFGAGGRRGADHLRPAADAGGACSSASTRCISASCWCSAWASACSRRRSASASTAACLIGKVPIEETVKPILGYLGLLFLCLLVIAFVPSISTWLPHAMGYGK